MKRLFLITVDCDMRIESIQLRQEALDALLRAFAESGARGSVTWFLNENDFALTRNHAPFIEKTLAGGDTIGVHDHLDHIQTFTQENLRDYLARSKTQVESFLRSAGMTTPVIFHRTGCVVQHPEIYAALRTLGYRVVSDVYPMLGGLSHDLRQAFDNRLVPEGIRPYRHDPSDCTHYLTRLRIASTADGKDLWKPFGGHFIQIPICHMFIKMDFARVARWIRISEAIEFSHPPRAPDGVPSVLTWCFHPYEILDETRTKVAEQKLSMLRDQLRKLTVEHECEFVNMATCVKALAGILYNEGEF